MVRFNDDITVDRAKHFLWLTQGIGFSPGLNGTKIRAIWDARRVTTPIISKLLPVATPTQAGSLCYTNTVARWLWARGTPLRKHFERALDTPVSNVA